MEDTAKNNAHDPRDQKNDDVTSSESEDMMGSDAQAREEGSDEKSLENSSMEDLMDMYEESFKRFDEGEVVTGRIISIDKDHVLVDIGYKTEGQIRINEFKDAEGNIDAHVDDSVEVMVEW